MKKEEISRLNGGRLNQTGDGQTSQLKRATFLPKYPKSSEASRPCDLGKVDEPDVVICHSILLEERMLGLRSKGHQRHDE
jgi:hypothetical protein